MTRLLIAALLLLPALASAQTTPATAASAPAPQVLLKTSQGDITLELYPDKSPKTVANFLQYVREGFYAGTVFHRVIKGFLIQGGIYDRDLQERRTHPAIPDEADNGLSNLRGTIAAARAPEVTQSATSQFFINLVDNRRLDYVGNQNGLTWGYAVFGKVTKGMDVVGKVTKGMDVVDKIAALPTIPLGPFSGDVPKPLVVIESAEILGENTAPSGSVATPASAAIVKPAAKPKKKPHSARH
jgi:peptidyl-prolyl cis-trans isomerase A (cyclophilin A)